MSARNFREMLEAKWTEGKFVCVGLDSELGKIPTLLQIRHGGTEQIMTEFNRAIVDATCDLVCAYKPNIAFYERQLREGWGALWSTICYIHTVAPSVPVILDAKRADIGNTNVGYVTSAFDILGADAITVHPYLGREALQPFLDRKDKGIFVLCRTSNPGAGEFQDIHVHCASATNPGQTYFRPVYQIVASHVANDWNKDGNCALVVGATYPEELQEVRQIIGDLPILIPGVGAQGGDVEKTVVAGKDSRGRGMIINSSRGIIFASDGEDFAEAARRETEKLHNLINQYR